MTNRLLVNGMFGTTNGGASHRDASPFLDAESFESSDGTTAVPPVSSLSSPFLQRFVDESVDGEQASALDARRLLLSELHDDEFEGALYELAGEGARAVRTIDDPRAAAASLQLTYAPLLREADAALQRVRDRLGDRDPAQLTESELEDAFGDRGGAPLTPAMENFLGGLGRLVKKAAAGAVDLAKKGISAVASLGLKPIIDQFRKLLPKVLGQIVKRVIHRIPAALQPDARRLAQALHIPVAEEILADESNELAFDITPVQSELNERVADFLLGEGETDTEYEGYNGNAESIPGVGVHDLDRARERFVGELAMMQDGEDATPAVERFVPALIPALMLAKKLVGRDRIVKLITPLVSKLIAGFIGPQSSNALSGALVDAGLKMVGFEVPNDDGHGSAREAVANTVEETVRRVAALPNDVLDDPELAEGAIVHEFERAAAANFPPLLPRPVYRRRPDLLEADRTRGVWVPCRTAHRRRRYKKYSRVFRTRVTPRMAMVIPTFGGGTLGGYLHEQLGAEPGEALEAEVHLYEAMPGMLLSEIGEEEGEMPVVSEYDVHPLTSEAASLLLGEPGLGEEVARPLGPARAMAVGQRFYRLSIPNHRVANVATMGTAGVVRGRKRHRRTHLHVTLNVPNATAVLSLYLSERRAQEMATALRSRANASASIARLRPVVERLLRGALSGGVSGRVRILHPKIDAAAARGPALRHLSAAHLQQFTTHLLTSAISGVSTFLKGQSARFITATEDVKDGVTLRITVAHAQGMAYINRTLGGTATSAGPSVTTAPQTASLPNAATTATASAAPTVTVDVIAGHRHG